MDTCPLLWSGNLPHFYVQSILLGLKLHLQAGEILLQVNLCSTFSETGEHLVDVNKDEALVCLHCVSGLGSYNMSQSKCELAGISTRSPFDVNETLISNLR